ncbi:MAG: NADH-quinone oxidoreductase subunit L [Bacillota bacterium]|jgi:formate hydrogenlyase subunit 3/multisubunit Na+/H+ antiporter MnhD subunit
MKSSILFWPILVPAVLSLVVLLVDKGDRWKKETVTLVAVLVNLIVAIKLFGQKLDFSAPWGAIGIDFSLRLYHFSSFILLAVAAFAILIGLYTTVFMRGKSFLKQYYFYFLLTLAMVNGAVLSNNLVVMLFFWEGLLVTLFGFIMTGGRAKFPTAVKALVLAGVADLCLMLGIGMTGYLAGTLSMDQIRLPLDFWGGFAFVFLMLGAIGKAGSMPFHSWIPDAAIDAPLPFMAFLPAALEKLLGIYFLARISLDLFELIPGSSMSILMMTIGAITIILAVMMALIQKDYKRLLSYHAISQVGYMILGVGTAIPVGIVGGLFHMINHAMYKSCLFLTGGAVEKQTGTTDLKMLGGLGKKMPVTFGCFIVAAAAISGVPPFNGFFSKELVFDGALESGKIFYLAAVVGAFLTAASFLKLGHAAFAGKCTRKDVKEAPWSMLIPMIVIAFGCILFGVYNSLPLNHLIQPILGERLHGHSYAGLPHTWTLVVISIIVLLLAVLNHFYGVKRTGSGLGAVDHIHYAPVLHPIYNMAEKRYFDPYDILLFVVNIIAYIFYWVDRGIDWIYNRFTVWLVSFLSGGIRTANNGSQARYLAWSLSGLAVVIVIFASLL